MTFQRLMRPGLPELAYVAAPGRGPCVVFLGGFRSDMTGAKATYLEAACRERGQAFLRFDYSGHGASGGRFEEGTIGGWLRDALDVIDTLTQGKVLLAGSSMGGWIALLAALQRPERIAGLLGIAAAPDFTGDFYGPRLTQEQARSLEEKGQFLLDSTYGEPYVITRALIEESRAHMLLDRTHDLPMPVRLIHGMADAEVPWRVALKLSQVLSGGDVRVLLVEDGEHRLSRPGDLDLMDAQLRALTALCNGDKELPDALAGFVPCRIYAAE